LKTAERRLGLYDYFAWPDRSHIVSASAGHGVCVKLPDLSRLTPAQRAALRHADDAARRFESIAHARVNNLLRGAGGTFADYDEAIECILTNARVVVHFHPDRFGRSGKTVAESLLEEGIYRNQFETGLSSGSLSGFPGGERDSWENALFAGAYHAEGVTSTERPKYGSLEIIRHPDGPIPRFGSSYFVLRPRVFSRTTFTFMGSEDPRAPERLGTIDRIHPVMVALFTEIEAGAMATPPWPPFQAPTLGVRNLTISGLLKLVRELRQPRPDPANAKAGRVLDTGIEAQVHGPIDLREDVERLVLDPAFASTAVGEIADELGRKYRIPIQWHCGFQLAVREVPDDFRGPAMPRLAQRIAGIDGTLDASVIGRAAASLYQQPENWVDWGSPQETLQHLKFLWHVLVHHGLPFKGKSEIDRQTRK
jgi:Protein of unknown function (DUF3626)